MEREKDLQERLQETTANYVRTFEAYRREQARKVRAYDFILARGLGSEFLSWEDENPRLISEKAACLLFDGIE